MSEEREYRNIFKTTFLFGFVQVFNILLKVGLNKSVAILLGANGMGVIGLFNSSISFLQTGAGLGISQSAVRDISEAYASHDIDRFSYIIAVTKRVVLFTSLFGGIITIVLSPFLSSWIFGNQAYTISFVFISIVVTLNILSDGWLAVLKGMRQLRALAKASMIGSAVGLFSAVPCYYLWGESGIVPSLIVASLSALYFSHFFVKRMRYKNISLSFRNAIIGSFPMVKMGGALMLVSFAIILFNLIIATFIRANGSLSDVGYYNAGSTIVTSYFGIVITAMSTDYYPRISAVYKDNKKLSEEVNKQSEVGLVLIFPLVILFVFLAPIFISILYSSDFAAAVNYTDYAMLGTILIICSHFLGMILLVKQQSRVFLLSMFGQRIFLIFVYMFGYKYGSLTGLGVAYVITGLSDIILMSCVMRKMYNIKLSKRVYCIMSLILFTTILSIVLRVIDDLLLRYSLGMIPFCYSLFFSYTFMKRKMNVDFFSFVCKVLRRKK